MDQVLTGKFIAEERKRKGFTQKQLSEKLEISDKTISKWECGNGFPEVSLLLPLCSEIDVTVNELLSGERVSEENYRKKAEENMVNLVKENEENTRKMRLNIITGIISTVSFVVLILIVVIYTEAISTIAKLLLVLIACAIFSVGLIVVMQGERTIGYYQCNDCGEFLVPTFLEYMMGIHTIKKRRLKCPKCGKKSWCKKVMSKERR